ncbi:hypothetical protein [Candidatus Bodocaedibacter vickermanii]|uniref:GNAT family N-acetyltransferase n=1 Tax=Candidatus Bodocaedibacter vickermanii TaxID=2741701 RepID=A0A7L9RUI1_9PROT|nr:GNAT family N-acetyltransferase [Candidatus Paracaedibacteraceae bacterium 'Lake Konstanz']
MRLFKYLTLCFLISVTSGADVLKMEPGQQFCSSAARSVYLKYVGGKTQQRNGSWGYEREFALYQLPEGTNPQSIGNIRLCFSSEERLIMLDKLEIYENFRRRGFGKAAIIVGFKIFTNFVSGAFHTYRVIVEKENIPANNLYGALGFRRLSDAELTKLFGTLKDYVIKLHNILDLSVAEFLIQYPKPTQQATLPDSAKTIASATSR